MNRYLLPPGDDELAAYISVMGSTHNLAHYWGAYGITQEVIIVMLIFRSGPCFPLTRGWEGH